LQQASFLLCWQFGIGDFFVLKFKRRDFLLAVRPIAMASCGSRSRVSIVLFFGAARVFRDGRYWRELILSLPFVIGGFGCLGVISTVAHLFFHRQPHSATGYETTWFFVGVVGFVFSVFFLRRRA
jgi:hypothetical protein